MNKYSLYITSSFKKDYKKIMKRGYDTALLNNTVELLLTGENFPEK